MLYIKVKNWEKFQHYKRRNPPWIRLYNSLLDDYDFLCLQDASKLLAIMIWLLASRTDNLIPLDVYFIKTKTGIKGEINIDELVSQGFLILCDKNGNEIQGDASNMLATCLQDASNLLLQSRAEQSRAEKKENTQRKKRSEKQFQEITLEIYKNYPRREGGSKALESIEKAYSKINPQQLLELVKEFQQSPMAKTTPREFLPHATTWFNQERWRDRESWKFERLNGNPKSNQNQIHQDKFNGLKKSAEELARGTYAEDLLK